MSKLLEAVRHMEGGDWQAAHTIAQDDASPLGSWAHGIVHMMEGDLSNAGHWYRKADRTLPNVSSIESEIAELKVRLTR